MDKSKRFLSCSLLKRSIVKELISKLEFFYKCDTKELLKYHFYITNKQKVYISTVNVDALDLHRINAIGMYFGTFHDEQRFRLSIEGSKLVKATRNIIELDEKSFSSYITGENLFKDEVASFTWEDHSPFLIVKYGEEHLGCMSPKDDMFLTYLPKSRKLSHNKVF